MSTIRDMYRLWRIWLFLRYVDKKSINFKAAEREIKFAGIKEGYYQQAVKLALNKESFIKKYPEHTKIPRVKEEGVAKLIERAECYGFLEPDPKTLKFTDKGNDFILSPAAIIQEFNDKYPVILRILLELGIIGLAYKLFPIVLDKIF